MTRGIMGTPQCSAYWTCFHM